VKSHYLNPLNKVEEFSSAGVIQGGVVSPIVLNIYLHEFDKFMQIKVEKSKKVAQQASIIMSIKKYILKYRI